jgi:hypothetical protein
MIYINDICELVIGTKITIAGTFATLNIFVQYLIKFEILILTIFFFFC